MPLSQAFVVFKGKVSYASSIGEHSVESIIDEEATGRGDSDLILSIAFGMIARNEHCFGEVGTIADVAFALSDVGNGDFVGAHQGYNY